MPESPPVGYGYRGVCRGGSPGEGICCRTFKPYRYGLFGITSEIRSGGFGQPGGVGGGKGQGRDGQEPQRGGLQVLFQCARPDHALRERFGAERSGICQEGGGRTGTFSRDAQCGDRLRLSLLCGHCGSRRGGDEHRRDERSGRFPRGADLPRSEDARSGDGCRERRRRNRCGDECGRNGGGRVRPAGQRPRTALSGSRK